jgi:hypothetical protein
MGLGEVLGRFERGGREGFDMDVCILSIPDSNHNFPSHPSHPTPPQPLQNHCDPSSFREWDGSRAVLNIVILLWTYAEVRIIPFHQKKNPRDRSHTYTRGRRKGCMSFIVESMSYEG